MVSIEKAYPDFSGMHAYDAPARSTDPRRRICALAAPRCWVCTAISLETDPGLRRWLLELIGEAKDERALPLFLASLPSDDYLLKRQAIHGLQKLNTREARRALWENS